MSFKKAEFDRFPGHKLEDVDGRSKETSIWVLISIRDRDVMARGFLRDFLSQKDLCSVSVQVLFNALC